MSYHLESLLDAERRGECAATERKAVEGHAAREKARAKEAMNRLVVMRKYGICTYLPYWVEVNHTEACIRDALRAHRFARCNRAIQAFGAAMRDQCAEVAQ